MTHILEFRVYSWPLSNFQIGPNSAKETNHLTLSLGPWPLDSQQKIHKSVSQKKKKKKKNPQITNIIIQ